MKRVLLAAVALLSVGLVLTSIGWYRAAHPGEPGRLSCRFENGELALHFTYGSGQLVTTQLDTRNGRAVASIHRRQGGRDHLLPLYLGETHYSSIEPGTPIEYPNGHRMNCPEQD